MMSFYVHGLMAIVETWLKNDCADSIDYVMELIDHCIRPAYDMFPELG